MLLSLISDCTLQEKPGSWIKGKPGGRDLPCKDTKDLGEICFKPLLLSFLLLKGYVVPGNNGNNKTPLE